ncbi:MAG: hypothetical protein KBA30_04695 [Clostridia bacterium]|nr:hypothetical protein [Clostridia bacterium]
MDQGERVYAVICPPYREVLYKSISGGFLLIADVPLTPVAKRIFSDKGTREKKKVKLELSMKEAYNLALQVLPYQRLGYYFD